MIRYLQTFSGHQNPIYALANSDKAGILFSAGNDKGIVEWSLKKMAFVMVKWPVQTSVYCLYNYNNKLYAGERSGIFTVFDFIKQELLPAVNAHSKPIFDIKVLQHKQELLTASEDGTIAIWSLQDLKEVYRFAVANTTVRTIAISPDEKEIAVGSKDNDISIYDALDFQLKHRFKAHALGVTSLAWHPKGKYLLSGGRDAQLNIWDTSDWRLRQNIPAHMFTVYAIAFHPFLPYFATCSQDKSIKVWDSENFKLYKILSIEKSGVGHSHSVNALIWSPDGKLLISCGDDRQVIIWEMES